MNRPLAIDLFCGDGGWSDGLAAAGFRVIGFDIRRYAGYKSGRLVLQDIKTLSGWQLRDASVIIASPPCEEFTRHMMPWTKRRNPPPPSLDLIEAAFRIGREAGVPTIIENVRETQKWIGSARCHYGPFYLWGDVPALLPYFYTTRDKQTRSSTAAHLRARIPFELAFHIAKVFFDEPPAKPAASASTAAGEAQVRLAL